MMQEMRAPNRCSSGQMNTDLGPAFLASWPRPWPAQEENCHIHICHSCLGAGLGDHAGPRQWPHQGAHPRTCRCNVWACLGTLPFTSQGLFWWQELEYRLISKVEAKAVYCRTLYMRSSCAFSIVVVHVRGLDNAYRHFSLLTAVGTVILNKISNCTRFLNGHGWLSICEDEHPPVPGSTCNGLSTIPVF